MNLRIRFHKSKSTSKNTVVTPRESVLIASTSIPRIETTARGTTYGYQSWDEGDRRKIPWSMRPTSSSLVRTSAGGTRLREYLAQGCGRIRSGWSWLGLWKVLRPISPWRFWWCVPRKSESSSASFLSLLLLGFPHGNGPHLHGWCLCTFGGL